MPLPKYRAWHKTEKRMFDVFRISYPDNITDREYVEIEEDVRIKVDPKHIEELGYSEYRKSVYHKLEDLIVMQSTDFLDMFKKNIYQGDILCPEQIFNIYVHPDKREERDPELLYEVRYGEYKYTPMCENCDDMECYGFYLYTNRSVFDSENMGELKKNRHAIIGNIFENPDLLPS